MESIKILKSEPKITKNNKPYKALEVEVSGEVRKVNMWSNFPNYASLGEGSLFEAKMTKEGQYWNLSYESSAGGRSSGYGANSASKTASINKAMDRKEESITLAGAQRDAVLIVKELIEPSWTTEEIKEAVVEWRNWFLSSEFKNNIPPF